MKIKIYILAILLFSTIQLFSQEFQTSIIAESNGLLDTITIGFDSSASIQVDNQFGEFDISNSAFNSIFEIRVGQINLNNLSCDFNSGSNLVT